jgi:organic hydroperoxide reductase OsmC/OhrA
MFTSAAVVDHAPALPFLADAARIPKAKGLHEAAHTYCFIARSVNFPIRLEAKVEVGA